MGVRVPARSRPRVAIAGGSLAGLNAALYLCDAGCDIEVFERSPVPLQGQGAGIVLNPATVRYLVDNDLVEPSEISVGTRYVRYLDDKGEIATEEPIPFCFTAYSSLHGALAAAFDPDRYHLNSPVEDFDQDDGQVAVRAGGHTATFDLLVCADGIRSAARARLLPAVRPHYAGYVAWRGTLEPSALSPQTRTKLEDAIAYHVLQNSHLLTYPIPGMRRSRDEYLVNWLWYVNVEHGAPLWRVMTDVDGVCRDISLPPGLVPAETIELLRHDACRRLPPPLAELVLTTEQPFVQAIVDIEVSRMAFGHVCLIGDAAFAGRPHAAAGSAKAAEDAYWLGRAVAEAGGNIPAALARWEPGQLALGHGLIARTREAGERAQFLNTWRTGDPMPFGLYRTGDSVMSSSKPLRSPRQSARHMSSQGDRG
jgi:2,6-dihydroxypyridine 3-monooxygenase